MELDAGVLFVLIIAAFAFGVWYDEDYSISGIARNALCAIFWPILVLNLLFGFKELMAGRRARRRRNEITLERWSRGEDP